MNAMNSTKKAALLFLVSLMSASLALAIESKVNDDENGNYTPATTVGYSAAAALNNDFTIAAEKSVNAVVHVKTKTIQQAQTLAFPNDPFFEYFFGQPQFQQRAPQPIQGSGSGVIISTDGYIVTNNHVVKGADEIEIVLNDKRTFPAKVIGADQNTDLALLKIDADNLHAINFGNSESLKVGEWVLAVGNPFNLTSTVTAGIVSAKARNINIINGDMKIESFIQTDAAVNPGNSGGALVNTAGDLVGINTAIASQTGSYAGYSFAVPVTIVAKVVADLKEFGQVQRAILGVSIRDIDDKLAKEKNFESLEGVFIESTTEDGAAAASGIKAGDVITKINDTKVKSVAELQEQMSKYRPGDKVVITALRDKDTKTFNIEFKNKRGNTSVIKTSGVEDLGVEFKAITDKHKKDLGISFGLQVSKIDTKGRFAKAGIQNGFIVLKINNLPIKTEADVTDAISKLTSSMKSENVLFISGVYPTGQITFYAVNMEDQ